MFEFSLLGPEIASCCFLFPVQPALLADRTVLRRLQDPEDLAAVEFITCLLTSIRNFVCSFVQEAVELLLMARV
jgi:hypothetical protein